MNATNNDRHARGGSIVCLLLQLFVFKSLTVWTNTFWNIVSSSIERCVLDMGPGGDV
jgi:hypothetical protein